MATTSTSAAVAAAESVFTEPERLALAGFLAGYTGLTREAYALDLRQFTSWCQQHHIGLFHARRADIECFARDLETRGRARATITRPVRTDWPAADSAWLGRSGQAESGQQALLGGTTPGP
jgi:integrase/recombinase XerD